MERYDGIRQANKDQRARIADATVNPIFELAPVRRRLAELVRHEFIGERLGETSVDS